MSSSIIDSNIQSLKGKYPAFGDCKDYQLFTLLCTYSYFYGATDALFDQDEVKGYLVDGANDGGFDAVFKDPNSEDDDIAIIQCKYYKNAKLKIENITGEITKIRETLQKLNANTYEGLSKSMVTAFKNAIYEKSDKSDFNIYFFASYEPTLAEKKKFKRAAEKAASPYKVELHFAKDIEEQIGICESGKVCVESDKLEIDKAQNCLRYINPETQNESIIVNVSAESLKDLYQRKGNLLLGLNLRYYVKQKHVDDGLRKTITKDPDKFWYKNNGIVIVCESYALDGKDLKLKNFSIVNGGQTTNRIGNIDFKKDFYITCKVIQTEGIEEAEKDAFALEIAESTNAQKPIRKADLLANTPEQIRLKERLAKYGVYYVLKKGDKPKSKYAPYEVTKVDAVGKLSLAAILQMPGSARSNSAKMYYDENRHTIWGSEAQVGVIKDLLRLDYYYKRFIKTDLTKITRDENIISAMKNGRTFQLACISLLCKIAYGVFSYEGSIAPYLNNVDALKRELRKMEPMGKLVSVNLDEEEAIFRKIFTIISTEVLGYGIDLAKEISGDNNIDVANYLKSDENYYRYCVKRLWNVFTSNQALRSYIYSICGIDKE